MFHLPSSVYCLYDQWKHILMTRSVQNYFNILKSYQIEHSSHDHYPQFLHFVILSRNPAVYTATPKMAPAPKPSLSKPDENHVGSEDNKVVRQSFSVTTFCQIFRISDRLISILSIAPYPTRRGCIFVGHVIFPVCVYQESHREGYRL